MDFFSRIVIDKSWKLPDISLLDRSHNCPDLTKILVLDWDSLLVWLRGLVLGFLRIFYLHHKRFRLAGMGLVKLNLGFRLLFAIIWLSLLVLWSAQFLSNEIQYED